MTQTIIKQFNGAPLVTRDNYLAGEAFSPGHLLQLNSSGALVKATVDGSDKALLLAVENNAGKDYTTPYAVGDQVNYVHLVSGTIASFRLAANAPAVTIADQLSIKAGGTVETAAGAERVVAFAQETIDNSSNASEVLIKIAVK